jgi:hypothetical protein
VISIAMVLELLRTARAPYHADAVRRFVGDDIITDADIMSAVDVVRRADSSGRRGHGGDGLRRRPVLGAAADVRGPVR